MGHSSAGQDPHIRVGLSPLSPLVLYQSCENGSHNWGPQGHIFLCGSGQSVDGGKRSLQSPCES